LEPTFYSIHPKHVERTPPPDPEAKRELSSQDPASYRFVSGYGFSHTVSVDMKTGFSRRASA
jgi:hypothetical protein